MNLIPLKQSTAKTILIGPFLDATDGVTEETGLATTGTEISKDGGAFAAGPTLGTHDSDGWYPLALTTAHTDTLGLLVIKVHDSTTHLPVRVRCFVYEANIFDSLYGNADLLDVNASQLGGTVQTGNDVGADVDAILTDTAEIGVAGAGLTEAGGTGDQLTAIPNAATIADAVWDEDIVAAHGTADTAGLLLRALGALISQRTNNPTLNALLGVADSAGEDLPSQILTGETLAELAQGIPAATPTLEAAIMLLYMAMRNGEEQTSSEYRVKNDAGTVIAKSAISDDGTTTTKDEMVSGP